MYNNVHIKCTNIEITAVPCNITEETRYRDLLICCTDCQPCFDIKGFVILAYVYSLFYLCVVPSCLYYNILHTICRPLMQRYFWSSFANYMPIKFSCLLLLGLQSCMLFIRSESIRWHTMPCKMKVNAFQTDLLFLFYAEIG